jgi:hypothetical protein
MESARFQLGLCDLPAWANQSSFWTYGRVQYKTVNVMRWARKRPSSYEIAMALLGVADTLADSALKG